MKRKELAFKTLLVVLPCLLLFACRREQKQVSGPLYRDATYGGETVRVENAHMRLEVYKRLTGWGWVEIFDANGTMMAVLDHLGEVDPVGTGRVFPLRLESQEYRLDKGEFGQRLTFPVQMKWYDAMRETRWAESPWVTPHLEGTVTITLEPDAARAKLVYDLHPVKPFSARYIRGLWLKVGAGSFGVAKTDGLFPGVDWVIGDEWSSGTDYMQHPHALRVVPHPYKASAPVLAVSYKGTAVGLAWDPMATVMSGKRYVQPVYASPNFVDRANNHLMGLSLPSAAWGIQENRLPTHTKEPKGDIELAPGTPIRIEAEVFLAKGNSLDALVAWVKRNGLPEPPQPRYSLTEALDRIARAYNNNLWHEGRGWGRTPEQARLHIPAFLERYAKEGSDIETLKSIKAKLDWIRQQPPPPRTGRGGLANFPQWDNEARLEHGRQLLSYQRADGSFAYDPEGRHKGDLIQIAAALHKPLGRPGDTGLDLNMQPAMELFALAELTGERRFRNAARKALDYCMRMERPDGGDWWETPLPSANLLAAGNAAIAYYLGHRAFNDQRYLDKAIYWIRALLAFTHLWQPEQVVSLYNTKPCLNQTMYYGSSWVDNHVQWEVLRVFAQSAQLGIEWGQIDPEIDWNRYHRGVTVAVLRWMVDSKDPSHPGTPPGADAERAKKGLMDTFFYDVHDSVKGDYRGALIDPATIAANIYAVLDRK